MASRSVAHPGRTLVAKAVATGKIATVIATAMTRVKDNQRGPCPIALGVLSSSFSSSSVNIVASPSEFISEFINCRPAAASRQHRFDSLYPPSLRLAKKPQRSQTDKNISPGRVPCSREPIMPKYEEERRQDCRPGGTTCQE